MDQAIYQSSTGSRKSKQTWAKLIQKVYDMGPLIYPKCQSEMKVIAVITESDEIRKILACLKKNKSPRSHERAMQR
jgi:hypothetical protein